MDNRSRSISPSRDINRSRSPPIMSPRGKSPIPLSNRPIPPSMSTNNKTKNLIPSNVKETSLIPMPKSTTQILIPKSLTQIPIPKSPTPKSPKQIPMPKSQKQIPMPKSPKQIPMPRSPKAKLSVNESKNNEIILVPTKKDNDIINMNNYTDVMMKKQPKTNELILREWQIDWHKKAHNILLSSHFYIDTSPMRSGKTFIGLKLAKDFDLELMVICPLTTKNYWKNMANKYGIKLFTDPVNYESLVRGTTNEIVKLYLQRKSNKTHTFFEATEAYKNALKNRKILLILDEGQMIKNDCLQHKACNALIQPIIAGGGRSRFGILSGTLIDKPEQIINLFRTIGYIRAPKLYVTIKGSKNLNLDGTQQLIDVCKQINFVATTKFLAKTPIPVIETDKKIKDEINDFCFALYVEIIKPKVAGAMSAPTTAEGELFIRNGYFHILPEKANQLKNSLEELKFSSGYKSKNKSKSKSEDEDDNNLNQEIKSKKSGDYIKSLVQIEKSKLLDMARVAKKILAAQDTNKVIITINYTGSKTGNLEELLGYLTEYDPLVLTGKTLANKRDIIIENFNNDPAKRILIANPKPISVGISLVGDGQRYMLISPSAKLMEIVQLSARVYGDQLKTDSYVYIFYGIIGGNLEADILQFMGTKKLGSNKIDTDIKKNLEKKSDILGRMQENEIRINMKLPSDYEDEYEDEDEVFY